MTDSSHSSPFLTANRPHSRSCRTAAMRCLALLPRLGFPRADGAALAAGQSQRRKMVSSGPAPRPLTPYSLGSPAPPAAQWVGCEASNSHQATNIEGRSQGFSSSDGSLLWRQQAKRSALQRRRLGRSGASTQQRPFQGRDHYLPESGSDPLAFHQRSSASAASEPQRRRYSEAEFSAAAALRRRRSPWEHPPRRARFGPRPQQRVNTYLDEYVNTIIKGCNARQLFRPPLLSCEHPRQPIPPKGRCAALRFPARQRRAAPRRRAGGRGRAVRRGAGGAAIRALGSFRVLVPGLACIDVRLFCIGI
jgi:hypothetical protein